MSLSIKHLPELQLGDFSQYRLSWREAGQGDAVVLLHGISSSSASWISQLTASSLTDSYHLYCWDAPGYMNSTELDTTTPVALDYADALEAFLDGLGVQQVVLIGHSLGALMACAFASLHPHRVNGLFLADPAQGYATKNLEERNRVYSQRHDIVFKSGIAAWAQHRAAALLSPDATPEKIEWVKNIMGKLNPQGFLSAAWMLAHDDISLYLNAYTGPLEMLVGAEDTITSPSQVSLLAQQKQCPVSVISGAGHASYLDQPEAFNRQLTRFLSIASQRKSS
ncbi:alpha/beta hydrolase [uncultured Cedecea sp.]|uniref:alpha/beta fold hydrolase n=1 Tax=uncultured Cedecea sp. TaxID=988762 RepID=UPI00262EE285|nr:alpha/beta hydrolase [uncultured Cedecea sp.]